MLSSFVLKTTEQLQTKIKHSVSINHCLRHVLFGHFSMSLSLNSFFKDLFILSMLCLHACICIRYFLQKGSCLNATCVLVVAVHQTLGVQDWRLKRGSHIGLSPLTGVIQVDSVRIDWRESTCLGKRQTVYGVEMWFSGGKLALVSLIPSPTRRNLA